MHGAVKQARDEIVASIDEMEAKLSTIRQVNWQIAQEYARLRALQDRLLELEAMEAEELLIEREGHPDLLLIRLVVAHNIN
jgi:hypothetical protein